MNAVTPERYEEIKNLAKKIHDDNADFLKNASEEEIANFLKDYKHLCQTEEEMQILKNSILIVDDKEFLERYQQNKNVRLLSEYYHVPTTSIMSKLYEMQKYEKYGNNSTKIEIPADLAKTSVIPEENTMETTKPEPIDEPPKEEPIQVKKEETIKIKEDKMNKEELKDTPIKEYTKPKVDDNIEVIDIAEVGEEALEKANEFITVSIRKDKLIEEQKIDLARKDEIIETYKNDLKDREAQIEALNDEKTRLETKLVNLEKIIFAINKAFDNTDEVES